MIATVTGTGYDLTITDTNHVSSDQSYFGENTTYVEITSNRNDYYFTEIERSLDEISLEIHRQSMFVPKKISISNHTKPKYIENKIRNCLPIKIRKD